MARDDSVESHGSTSGSGVKQEKPASGKPIAAGNKAVRPGAKLSSATGAKKAGAGDDVDSSPLYAANKLKNNRFRDEAKLKLLKWNFTTPRQEFVDQLKEQVGGLGTFS
jgi:cytoskeleton-associated protein 5